MPRINRATQFAPFDALKGMQDALRLAEYSHDRVEKGDVSEEVAEEISSTLNNLEKNSIVKLKYFEDGHHFDYEGKIKFDIETQKIEFGKKKILLDNVLELRMNDEEKKQKTTD